jgi:hypothetical protein
MGLETKPLPLWVWRPNPYHYGFGDQTPTIMGLETKPSECNASPRQLILGCSSKIVPTLY